MLSQKMDAASQALTALEQIRRGEPVEQHWSSLAALPGWGALSTIYDHPERDTRGVLPQIERLFESSGAQAIRASVVDSYYTPPGIAGLLTEAVERMGFGGGRVLDPAAGTGGLIRALSAPVREASTLVMVEREPSAWEIASYLHPEATCYKRRIERIALGREAFDLVLGNPPFGTSDVRSESGEALPCAHIHDFALAKSVYATRPGGLIAFVMPRSGLDNRHADKVRRWIFERARLLAAVRLPVEAFEAEGARVTTDLLILRRRGEDDPALEDDPEAPLQIGEAVADDGSAVTCNSFFAEHHPEAVIGEWVNARHSCYGKRHELVASAPGWLEQARQALLAQLDGFAYRAPHGYAGAQDGAELRTPVLEERWEDAPLGTLLLDPADGQVIERQIDSHGSLSWVDAEPSLTVTGLQRIHGLIALRERLYDLLDAERNPGANESGIETLRKQLGEQYAAFVRRHGAVNAEGNRRVFKADPSYPLLQSLEVDYDRGITAATAKKHGVEPRSPSWKKAAIFSRRVIEPQPEFAQPQNASDALALSLARMGRVDLHWMSDALGCEPEEIIDALGGHIFRDPEDESWRTRDDYLSGNLREKLALAEQARKRDSAFAENVTALEAALPEPVAAADIACPLGAPWVPGRFVSEFILEHLEVEPSAEPQIIAGDWLLPQTPEPTPHLSENVYGTSRRPALDLIERGLNGRPVSVYDQIDRDTRVFNPKATQEAEERLEQIKRAWREIESLAEIRYFPLGVPEQSAAPKE